MATRRLKDLPQNLDKQISKDFNALIRKIHKTLATKKHSPVYTGFFASSWKVQGTPINPTDPIEKFEPWANIKRQATAEFLKNKTANKKYKSTGYYNVKPVIKPRFPIERVFNYTRAVYIGNKAEYSVYALEGGKLQLFIQGSLGKMIKNTMTDKGKIFIGTQSTFDNTPKSNATQKPSSVKYTEF